MYLVVQLWIPLEEFDQFPFLPLTLLHTATLVTSLGILFAESWSTDGSGRWSVHVDNDGRPYW